MSEETTTVKKAPERRARRWLRRALIATLLLFALIGTLIAAALIFFATDRGKEWVRNKAEAQMNSIFIGGGSIGRIEGSIFGNLVAHDVVINDASGEPAIAVKRAAVEFRLRPLLSDTLEINRLDLTGVDVAVRGGRDGTLNLAALTIPDQEEKQPSAFRLFLAGLTVTDATITFDFPDRPRDTLKIATIGHSSLEVAGGEVRLNIGSTEARLVERGHDVAFHGKVTLAGDKVELSELRAAVAGASLAVNRTVIAGADVSEVDATLSVPAASIAAVVPDSKLLADTELHLLSQGEGLAVDGTIGEATVAGIITLKLGRGEAAFSLRFAEANLGAIWLGLPPSSLALTADGRVASATEVTVAATVTASGTVAGKPLDSAKAVVQLEAGELRASVVATSAGSSADVTAAIALGGEDGEGMIIRESVVVFDVRNLATLGRPWVELAGNARGRLTASGPLESLTIKGEVTSSALRGFGVAASGVRLEPKLTRVGDRATGTVVVSADRLSTGGATYRDVRLEAVSRDGTTATLDLRGKAPGADAELRADVRESASGIVATVRRASGRYKGLAIRDLTATIAYQLRGRGRGRVAVKDAKVRTNVGDIEVAGEVATGGRLAGTLTIEARALDLAKLSEVAELAQPLRGTASFSASINTAKSATSTITLIIKDVSGGGVGNYPPTSGKVIATLRGRLLDLETDLKMDGTAAAIGTLRLRAPPQPFEPHGWSRLDRDALIAIDAKADIKKFAPFVHFHPDIPSKGTATITAKQTEGEKIVSVTVVGKKLLSARLDEAVDVRLSAELAGKRVSAKGDAKVDSRGRLSFDGAVALAGPWFAGTSYTKVSPDALEATRFEVRGIDIDWWAERFAPGLDPSGAKGEAVVTFDPSTKTAEVSATLALPKGGPRERKVPQSTTLTATVFERKAEARVVGTFAASDQLTGHGDIAVGWRDLLDGKRDPLAAKASAKLAIKKLPLLALREVLRTTPIKQDAELSGTLSATASFSGSINAPELAASASIDGAVVADVAFASILAGAKLKDGKLDVTATGDQRGGGRLVVRAETDIKREAAPILLRLVAAKFDLGFLAGVIPERGIGGIVTADITASGTRASPRVVGTADIKKGSLIPGAPLHGLRDIDLNAEMTGKRLTLKGKARSGRGRVTIDASAAIADNTPSSLKATLITKQLPVDAGTAMLRVGSRTVITGGVRDGKWELTADIRDATIELPDELSRELHPTELPEDIIFASDLEKEKEAMAPFIRELSLRIRARETILVRGGQANALVSVNLEIDAGDELRITGTASAEQGWVEIVGRRYDVRSAGVSFAGDPDPILDVEIAHEFQTMTLFIVVSGPASDPTVEFRSDPATYDDSELLSFVLGGSPDEPTGRDKGVASQATGVATSFLAGKLSNIVTKVTPIDVLRIETDDSSAQRVALGKWITEKLLIAYRYRFTADPKSNTSELTFEYRFLKRWLLEGYVGQEESGADVLWIRRY